MEEGPTLPGVVLECGLKVLGRALFADTGQMSSTALMVQLPSYFQNFKPKHEMPEMLQDSRHANF